MSTRTRIVLSETLAVEIYKSKPVYQGESSVAFKMKRRDLASAIASSNKVSAKTVYDIWNHVTWKYATSPLWSKEENGKENHQVSISFKISEQIKNGFTSLRSIFDV
jgi:hypothetical protein